ncbi:mRNA 3'-end-processing protein rna14 [Paramarasmius palmivorus]|uniref:mRNA 3'-end-processing protein RNA14 n=1 Tax=Paramarasmius palmivorus TaxID=297713 RepID=A0AAW0AZ95_9AGAR
MPSPQVFLFASTYQDAIKEEVDNDIEIDGVLQRLKNNPRDDMWGHILTWAEQADTATSKSLRIFESALECFPNTPAIQVAHLKKTQAHDSPYTKEEVERLFRNYLNFPSVALCNLYVSFMRGQSAYSAQSTYRFVLDLVGQEAESNGLWAQYLDSLEAAGENQIFRETLHEVVKIPLTDLPHFWSRLQLFEHRYHTMTAKDTLVQLEAAHAQALMVRLQLQHYMQVLYPRPVHDNQHIDYSSDTVWLPAPPLASVSNGQLVRKWEAYLKWEESDPLRLRESNMMAYKTRLRSAYLKANVRVRFSPELWLMTYKWWQKVGDDNEALLRLREGIQGNNASLLLHFALADTLEGKSDFDQARQAYEELLTIFRTALSDCPVVGRADISKDFGLVYIMYIRFTFRTEGRTAAQAVFSRAINDSTLLPWLVFEEVAKMERDHGGSINDTRHIFEAGMKQFSRDIGYVVCYLEWLITVNEKTCAQVLFESTVDEFPIHDAAQLWDHWSRYLYRCGDLDSIQEAERRMSKVYGTVDMCQSLPLRSFTSITFSRDVTKYAQSASKHTAGTTSRTRLGGYPRTNPLFDADNRLPVPPHRATDNREYQKATLDQTIQGLESKVRTAELGMESANQEVKSLQGLLSALQAMYEAQCSQNRWLREDQIRFRREVLGICQKVGHPIIEAVGPDRKRDYEVSGDETMEIDEESGRPTKRTKISA